MKQGRPRKFDEDSVVDIAMRTFWRIGFVATSVDDLTKAMKISRPSLYGAFGDKAQLFIRCLDHYFENYESKTAAELDLGSDWTSGVERFLNASIRLFTDPQMPGGCLVATHLGDEGLNQPCQLHVARVRAFTEQKLLKRIEKAKRSGELSNDASPKAISRTIGCFLAGLSIQSRAGATKRQLANAVGYFIAALRSSPDQSR